MAINTLNDKDSQYVSNNITSSVKKRANFVIGKDNVELHIDNMQEDTCIIFSKEDLKKLFTSIFQ